MLARIFVEAGREQHGDVAAPNAASTHGADQVHIRHRWPGSAPNIADSNTNPTCRATLRPPSHRPPLPARDENHRAAAHDKNRHNMAEAVGISRAESYK